MAAGQGMADEKLAAILAEGAPETIDELESWGSNSDREGDGYYTFKSCFKAFPVHMSYGAMENQLYRH